MVGLLSADGTRLAVGAPNNLGASLVRVYEYNGNNWVNFGDCNLDSKWK